ncbi:FAD-dependent monooxygenase [Gordonia sp. SL306]|uniref:FAD-dependent monooxygenase n=1 Tax=Gordonia sp. SL306 TaxID=2995145 RepID=UPI00226FCEC0|nr:FAD-dependent monooxygenase [Gordonia sp. SL306]WAC53516.1 FAD-dependent monooxygenase [Gordonia sp. SL306]
MSPLNVLVIGAGVAGAATAILLAERGIDVDLIDVKADVPTSGSGITLQGNALRVLRDLGVWDEASSHGYCFDTLGFRAPDGTLLAELPDARTGGEDLPATMGMYRPTLARILLEHAASLGVKARFGVCVQELDRDDTGVTATFEDQTNGRYDLVVGADGLRSRTRSQIGIDIEPQGTGMGIWRVFAPRPDSVTRTDLTYGGTCYIAGYCPTGRDTLYAYLVEDAQDRSALTPDEALETMRTLAADYHGPWDDIRDGMTDSSRINYTRFESHVVDGPWHRGRVVLIGDAAHSCPPTLAQGAAQALEDAAVLADVVVKHHDIDDAMWDEFTDRRLERAKAVVDSSVQLGRWMLDHEQGDVPGLMHRISEILTIPA